MARSSDLGLSGAASPAVVADGRPLRKDAQRTRSLVLDAARTLFAERGLDVSFDEIAKAAGVGVGTVYRRFPDREALIEALFADKVDRLLALVESAKGIEDPWDALVQLMERSTQQMQHDRAFAEVMVCASRGHEMLAQRRDDVTEAVGSLLRRAQDAGLVRTDLEVADVALLIHVVSLVGTRSGSETACRYLALVLEAIRSRPGDSPLPGRPLPMEHFEDIVQRL